MTCYVRKGKVIALLPLVVVMMGGSSLCTTISEWPAQIIGWTGVAVLGLFFDHSAAVVSDGATRGH